MKIPVKAFMQEQPDGSYKLVPEESEFAMISPDQFARYLIHQFGRDIPGM